MSGGFTPNLVHTTDPLSGWINVLASEHSMSKSVGITIDASTIPADADGNKIVKNGSVLGKITATGKYTLYDNAHDADGAGAGTAGDGREVARGILVNGGVNCKNGDVITGMLIHGSVLEARLTGLDAAAKADLPNIIFQ